MNALARRGLVSSKGVQNAINNSTKVQKSKMAPFHGRQKDEGEAHGLGHAIARVDEINAKATQADRARSAPSRNKGMSGKVGSAQRSKSTQGGHVGASQTPTRYQIDKFPRGQGKTFPAGAKVSAKGKKSVGVKGPPAKRTGGPGGSGRNYYGGSNRNPPEGG
jgi:hypothetical protein